MKIYILDDDSTLAIYFKRVIKKICPSSEVSFFIDPCLCLEHTKKNGLPDLIFSDFDMPAMNGDKFMEKIIDLGFSGKAFFITGWDIDLEQSKNVVKVIHKPIIKSELKQIIEDVGNE